MLSVSVGRMLTVITHLLKILVVVLTPDTVDSDIKEGPDVVNNDTPFEPAGDTEVEVELSVVIII